MHRSANELQTSYKKDNMVCCFNQNMPGNFYSFLFLMSPYYSRLCGSLSLR